MRRLTRHSRALKALREGSVTLDDPALTTFHQVGSGVLHTRTDCPDLARHLGEVHEVRLSAPAQRDATCRSCGDDPGPAATEVLSQIERMLLLEEYHVSQYHFRHPLEEHAAGVLRLTDDDTRGEWLPSLAARGEAARRALEDRVGELHVSHSAERAQLDLACALAHVIQRSHDRPGASRGLDAIHALSSWERHALELGLEGAHERAVATESAEQQAVARCTALVSALEAEVSALLTDTSPVVVVWRQRAEGWSYPDDRAVVGVSVDECHSGEGLHVSVTSRARALWLAHTCATRESVLEARLVIDETTCAILAESILPRGCLETARALLDEGGLDLEHALTDAALATTTARV